MMSLVTEHDQNYVDMTSRENVTRVQTEVQAGKIYLEYSYAGQSLGLPSQPIAISTFPLRYGIVRFLMAKNMTLIA